MILHKEDNSFSFQYGDEDRPLKLQHDNNLVNLQQSGHLHSHQHDDNIFNLPEIWFFICLFGTFANGELMNRLIFGKELKNSCFVNLVLGNLLVMLCLPLEILHNHGTSKTIFMTRNIAGNVQISSLLVLAIIRLKQAVKIKNQHKQIYKSDEVSVAVVSVDTKRVQQDRKYPLPNYSYTKVTTNISEKSESEVTCDEHSWFRIEFSERLSVLATLLIWCLAVCSSIPQLFNFTYSCYTHSNNEEQTFKNYSGAMYYSLAIHIVPLFTVLYCLNLIRYILIEIPEYSGNLHFEIETAISMATLMLVNYFLTHVFITYICLMRPGITLKVMDYTVNFPVYIIACSVPLVAYISSQSIQNNVNNLLCCKSCKRRELMNKVIHI